MPRIAGVNLPENKKIEISLRYILGIGPSLSSKVLNATGISYDKRVHELTEDEVAAIRNEIQRKLLWLRVILEKSCNGY